MKGVVEKEQHASRKRQVYVCDNLALSPCPTLWTHSHPVPVALCFLDIALYINKGVPALQI